MNIFKKDRPIKYEALAYQKPTGLPWVNGLQPLLANYAEAVNGNWKIQIDENK